MSICSSKLTKLLSASAVMLCMSAGVQAISFKVEDTDVDIYGYVKLDIIYDVDSKLGNAIMRGNIRPDNEPGVNGHTTMHAYESRLGFTTQTPINGHVLKTNIEGDFYGGGGFGDGGGEFRLRHAYGEWNGILAGQTYSNFGNILSHFPTVDFNGPLGQGGGRQAQLRYTSGNFSYSLEDPKEGGKIVAENTTRYRLPDLTARYINTAGPIKYAAAGLTRFLEYDSKGKNVNNPNWSKDSAVGWGLMLEAQTKLSENITLRGSVTHGDGIGGYLYLSPANPAYVDPNGKLKTTKATGGGVSLSVATGPGAFNIGYGLADTKLSESYANNDADKRYSSTFVNYIWSPIERITYGVEVGHHTRKQVDGDKGDAVRLQAMIKYGF